MTSQVVLHAHDAVFKWRPVIRDAGLGRSLRWDPVKHEVIGDKKANQMLARPYRKPWEHPDPAKV